MSSIETVDEFPDGPVSISPVRRHSFEPQVYCDLKAHEIGAKTLLLSRHRPRGGCSGPAIVALKWLTPDKSVRASGFHTPHGSSYRVLDTN
jgi:hypothetical protein